MMIYSMKNKKTPADIMKDHARDPLVLFSSLIYYSSLLSGSGHAAVSPSLPLHL